MAAQLMTRVIQTSNYLAFGRAVRKGPTKVAILVVLVVELGKMTAHCIRYAVRMKWGFKVSRGTTDCI